MGSFGVQSAISAAAPAVTCPGESSVGTVSSGAQAPASGGTNPRVLARQGGSCTSLLICSVLWGQEKEFDFALQTLASFTLSSS